MTAIQTLKQWFSNFKKPTQEQFWAWLDSFWHKSEKIPMTSIEGLENVIQGTASAEQLRNHLTDSQAHKGLFDGKVDKEAGKGLSTNDFTNAYKQQLDLLEDYDIELDESTTELKFKKGNNVVRRISLMFLDDEGTKLTYNKASKNLELRDKKDNLLTSIPVSHFVSNIPTNIVVQNGRIKLMAGDEVIDENAISYNDMADKPDLNFAPASHRHNWNEIDGKPNNLATTENIADAINNIQIGGRNLLRETKEFGLNNSFAAFYIVRNYSATGWDIVPETFNGNVVRKVTGDWQGIKTNAPDILGEPVIISFWAKTNAWAKFGNYATVIKNPNGIKDFTELSNRGVLISDNQWHRYTIYNPKGMCLGEGVSNGFIEFYQVNGDVLVSSIKIERGNKPTDWTPAPEDFIANNIVTNSSIALTHTQSNTTIFLTVSNSVDLSGLENLDCVSFRKVFAGGQVTFTCQGKEIVYTGDNQFNGGDGSTAVVSVWNNKCYIDIRNI